MRLDLKDVMPVLASALDTTPIHELQSISISISISDSSSSSSCCCCCIRWIRFFTNSSSL